MNLELLELIKATYPNNRFSFNIKGPKEGTIYTVRYQDGFYSDDLGGRGWRITAHNSSLIIASSTTTNLLETLLSMHVDADDLTKQLNHLAYTTVLWYTKSLKRFKDVLGVDYETHAQEWERKLLDAAFDEIDRMTTKGLSSSDILNDIVLRGKLPTKLTVVEKPNEN